VFKIGTGRQLVADMRGKHFTAYIGEHLFKIVADPKENSTIVISDAHEDILYAHGTLELEKQKELLMPDYRRMDLDTGDNTDVPESDADIGWSHEIERFTMRNGARAAQWTNKIDVPSFGGCASLSADLWITRLPDRLSGKSYCVQTNRGFFGLMTFGEIKSEYLLWKQPGPGTAGRTSPSPGSTG
jgi:hypothetical protein